MFTVMLAWLWGCKWYLLAGTVFCFLTGIGRPNDASRWSVRPVPNFLMRSVYVSFLMWLGLIAVWLVLPWIVLYLWAFLILVVVLVVGALVVIGGSIGASAGHMRDDDEEPSCPPFEID